MSANLLVDAIVHQTTVFFQDRCRLFPSENVSKHSGPAPAFIVMACLIGLPGCDDGAGARSSPQGRPGPKVDVPAQRLESGFALGELRKASDVPAFTISRNPVTVDDYRACVNAGLCEKPAETACVDWPERPIVQRPNFAEPGVADDVAVTCVGLRGAREYCRFVGGTLPTLEQWFLAARGGAPQRYPWGSTDATCEQHAFGASTDGGVCKQSEQDVGRILRHQAGASPFGVEDILLTTGELLDTSKEALFTSCRQDEGTPATEAESDAACIVYGLRPGAIDSVRELRSSKDEPDTTATPYGFRCVWGGAS